MNRDDIVRWAREVGFSTDPDDVWITDGYWAEELERFANLVAAAERDANLQQIEIIVEAAVTAEREACAKVCESAIDSWRQYYCEALNSCAAAIRARGQQ